MATPPSIQGAVTNATSRLSFDESQTMVLTFATDNLACDAIRWLSQNRAVGTAIMCVEGVNISIVFVKGARDGWIASLK